MNSTSLDCKRKFRNFIGSSFALRRISDTICVENGLSIIENPKRRDGRHYGKWLEERWGKRPTLRDNLRSAIDSALERNPKDFAEFLSTMRTNSFEVKHGKHISFRANGEKQFLRLDTLQGDYTENAIRERISGKRMDYSPGKAKAPNLLLDIENKLRAGKGEGYRRWASEYNLKQMAQTLIFLQANGFSSYDALSERAKSITEQVSMLNAKLKPLGEKLDTNAQLQRHIVIFAKTKAVYDDYRSKGYSQAFYAEHETEIQQHQDAKTHFKTLVVKKLPSVKQLREEYAVVLDEKRTVYREYSAARKEMKAILTAKANVDRLLGISDSPKTRQPNEER